MLKLEDDLCDKQFMISVFELIVEVVDKMVRKMHIDCF